MDNRYSDGCTIAHVLPLMRDNIHKYRDSHMQKALHSASRRFFYILYTHLLTVYSFFALGSASLVPMVTCYNHRTVALAAEMRKPHRGQACRSKFTLVADLEWYYWGGGEPSAQKHKNSNTEPRSDNIYLCTKSEFYQRWSFLSGFSDVFGNSGTEPLLANGHFHEGMFSV